MVGIPPGALNSELVFLFYPEWTAPSLLTSPVIVCSTHAFEAFDLLFSLDSEYESVLFEFLFISSLSLYDPMWL